MTLKTTLISMISLRGSPSMPESSEFSRYKVSPSGLLDFEKRDNHFYEVSVL